MKPTDSAFSSGLIPVVGVGASAGGLEALTQLFEALPADLGLAYLVVSHMDPRHESHMAEILAKRAAVTVTAACEQDIEPNHAYVIPPNTVMTLAGNRLVLAPRPESGKHLPIDALFESLAQQRPGKAVGIVLSGTGSDGAQGLKDIKEAAGVTLAQAPASAVFDGMPNAALQTGCVDLVLAPSEMAAELAKIASHPYFLRPHDEPVVERLQPEAALGKIFDLLKSVYQADFTQYKPGTVQRRLQRRMALVNETDVPSYLMLLQNNPVELAALYDDLLIRVTSFFREEAIHNALKQTVFPALMKDRSHSDPLRIWVPACATGEEVYSLAICLLQYLGEQSQQITIQIFGTDLNDAAIEQARQGLYPESIADRVSPSRLQRYFVHENRHYRVTKQVRELCVFARQNVALDPPFSRMDLISCCNLLIYLDAGLQRRVLRHFHYSLKPDGFLVLGPAESADEEGQYFRRAGNHSQRMLYKRATPSRGSLDVVARADPAKKAAVVSEAESQDFVDNTQVQRKADGLLLSRFAPASILVDDRLNIVQFRGPTGPYLQHASGTASLNLHRVAHPGILLQLLPMLKEAQQTGATVYKDDLRIETPTGARQGTVEVMALREPATKSSFCLILFDANSRPAKPEGRPEIPESEKDVRIRQLEEELESLRDYLHATNEAYEAALEESRSAQEELQSANEEFLSGNEELVTAREELQASNEELTTSNEELLSRSRELQMLNAELSASRREADLAASYAESVIDTVAHPLLVLDQSLQIHRANRAFYDTFFTNPGMTLNRRLFDLGDGQWNGTELRQLLDRVLTADTPVTGYRINHEFPGMGRKTMLINARKVPAMDYRSARILLAFEDATAAEQRMDALNTDDRRKDEFLAMLAHELRNPLAPISNALQVMRLTTQGENLRQPLDMIGRQVNTLTRLVNDLMDVSRITRGEFLLEFKPTGLVALLTQVVSAVTPYMDQRGHTLSAMLPQQEMKVRGDATRLEQVFGNLLNNAGKYTDRGGHIVLSLVELGHEAVVTVTDDGSGIPAAILPHIFELFVQSETTRSRAEGGLGIGLTLVRRIVEAHGGSVQAVSAGAGRGSKFVVRVPLAQAYSAGVPVNPSLPVKEEDNPVTSEGKPRRVLIVDDNVDAANSVAELARIWGHEVTLAYDGFSALESARTFAPQVALLDIGLPGMDGYALAGELRQLKHEGLFLIAMTGYGQAADREAAKKAGFDMHLVKPVEADSLQTLLAGLHSHSHSHS